MKVVPFVLACTLLLTASTANTNAFDCTLAMRGLVDGDAFEIYQCDTPVQSCEILIRGANPPKWNCQKK